MEKRNNEKNKAKFALINGEVRVGMAACGVRDKQIISIRSVTRIQRSFLIMLSSAF